MSPIQNQCAKKFLVNFGRSSWIPNRHVSTQKVGNYEDVFKLYEAVKELFSIKAYVAVRGDKFLTTESIEINQS